MHMSNSHMVKWPGGIRYFGSKMFFFYVTMSNIAVIDDAYNLDGLVFFMESAVT